MRSFEFIVELIVRQLSHQKWWSPTNQVKYTEEEKQGYMQAREFVKQQFYINLAINIGNPGDMVTGAAFQSFSSDHTRSFICSLVPQDLREDLNVILLGLCSTVKAINSQKRKVNVEKVRQLSNEVYKKLVMSFPWAIISPSVHRILAHSWEVIQQNDGFGLGNQSEEGLEALHKFIRGFRARGARKDSTLTNFSDTYHHMWDRSRPIILDMERKINKKKQRVIISTEIEAVVNNLFEEDEPDDE